MLVKGERKPLRISSHVFSVDSRFSHQVLAEPSKKNTWRHLSRELQLLNIPNLSHVSRQLSGSSADGPGKVRGSLRSWRMIGDTGAVISAIGLTLIFLEVFGRSPCSGSNSCSLLLTRWSVVTLTMSSRLGLAGVFRYTTKHLCQISRCSDCQEHTSKNCLL